MTDIFEHTLYEPSETIEDAFYKFKMCIYNYLNRDLSYIHDFMNAFSGISAVLESELRTPLLFGVPIKYFDWGILWNSEAYLGESRRRNSFPSWNWAG